VSLPILSSSVAVVAAVIAGLVASGAAGRHVSPGAGALIRWGLPLVTGVAGFAAALTIGLLVLTATVLPVVGPTPEERSHQAVAAYPPARRAAVVTATAWLIAAALQVALEYQRFSRSTPGGGRTDTGIDAFGFGTDAGRGLLVTIAIAGVVVLVAARARRLTSFGALTLLSVLPLVPAALAGSPVGYVDRDTAVTSLGLHLLGASVWTGSLAGLLLLHRRLGADLPVVARRYTRLANWSLGLVVLSGLVGAATRLPRFADLATGYGLVLGAKLVGACGLAAAAATQRRRGLRRLSQGQPGGFLWLATVELVILAAAAGLGVALAAGPPPSAAHLQVRSAAESISGYPMPPPLSGSRWLTEWQPDLLWLLVAALASIGYLAAVHRLRARGDRWSVLGTISWLIGVIGAVYITSGPLVVYGRVMFSMHMLGHMSLSMLVPVFLVLGAPVTLTLRALPPRTDGSRGPREWLIIAVHSRAARVLSFPPVAAFLFAGSLLFFYFSPLFGVALSTHVGLELMYAHFLFAGYVFAWVLIGVDPGPTRVPYPLRLITLLAAMAFHAFFGVALLSGSTVLAADYFAELGRTWGAGLLADQRLGGGIAWGIGDVPAIVLAVALAAQWSRDDEREARRLDRQADQDGNADLTAYNEMLARLAGTKQTPEDTLG
jgi:putative copper resistance protein D